MSKCCHTFRWIVTQNLFVIIIIYWLVVMPTPMNTLWILGYFKKTKLKYLGSCSTTLHRLSWCKQLCCNELYLYIIWQFIKAHYYVTHTMKNMQWIYFCTCEHSSITVMSNWWLSIYFNGPSVVAMVRVHKTTSDLWRTFLIALASLTRSSFLKCRNSVFNLWRSPLSLLFFICNYNILRRSYLNYIRSAYKCL